MVSHDTKTQRTSIVIGTAGHIDHGKTTLVHALTGVDTDRLPQEKRRGITIDLGFALLETKSDGSTPLQLSFVDVPGHHHFIRNMLAGTGGIDAVMLVISADEGVKPQTEEHLAICEMLGVNAGLTVVTKVDRVPSSGLDSVFQSIRRFLSGTFLDSERTPIIPVSAYSGQGMDRLRSELVSLATRIPTRNSDALPRLPIDRAFVMKGFGTVVTGTLMSGRFSCGQALMIEPGNRAIRVRGIQVHGRSEEVARGGSRVALNIAGVNASEIRRGQTVLPSGALAAVTIIDVEARLLPGAQELKHGCHVQFHAFSAEAAAKVSLYTDRPVGPGRARLMRLKLGKPIVLAPGDRFVLRLQSQATTIGGGRILDTQPVSGLRKSVCLDWLQQLRDAPNEEQLLLRIGRRGLRGLHLSALSVETGLTAEAITRIIRPLLAAGRLIEVPGDLLMTEENVESAQRLVMSSFDQRAKTSAGPGVNRSELRTQTQLSLELFNYALEELARQRQLRIQQEWVFPFDSGGQVPEKDQQLLGSIAKYFEAAGLAPPSSDEVAGKMAIERREMRRLMTLLLRDKTLVKLGNEELYMHQLVLTRLRSHIGGLRGQTLDVSQFKQLTGLSRKYAIPLLEYLDRERVTRKIGECRLVL
ncbi:MAG: selenocysteine-specific translation elongation factor [Acidobacteriaceae bacterium]